jgi:hypothetical protein
MRPATIAFLIILLIIVIKDPEVLHELIKGIVQIFSTSGSTNG